ncbi:MAG TPA: hypothetical protein VH813_02080 [Candidatus Limnocylindrales bacterium]
MAERLRQPQTTVVGLIRTGILDAQLASLVWLLAEGGLPVHVADAGDPGSAALAEGLADVAPAVVQVTGHALEEVLAVTSGDPAQLGVVLIPGEARVAAAHYVRPPLRDAGGHIRPQGPAVLATWDAGLGSFEHYAWGVVPELAERIGRRAGDVELELDRRREYLAGLAAAAVVEPTAVRAALDGYTSTAAAPHRH